MAVIWIILTDYLLDLGDVVNGWLELEPYSKKVKELSVSSLQVLT